MIFIPLSVLSLSLRASDELHALKGSWYSYPLRGQFQPGKEG